ncbi:MAG: hypothetical protein J7J38_03290 [Candidatus Aenigmarchaeota archaeon]|nr:hypothetical protein [Candidatus Aenigmarchaeota archaeon]
MEADSEWQNPAKKRGRPSGVDHRKLAAIIKILAENPDGLWLRKIAQKAGVHPTTVSNYIDKVLRPFVDDIVLGSDEKPIIRVIKLKSSITRKINLGMSIRELIKTSQIIRNIGKSEQK